MLSFGDYRDVPLKRAREKRDEARRLLADGIDPSAGRKAERIASASTLRAIGDEWLALQKKTLAANTYEIAHGRLTNMLYPSLGNLPISEIKAPDLLAVLRRIESRATHETAHRVRALFGRVARYAIATGRAERDEIRGAYNRATRMADRKAMMQAWADYLDEPRQSASSTVAKQQA